MSKTIIAIIIIIIVAGLGYWIYQSISAPKGITEAEANNCEVDSDCVVFGEDGDCNCGCFNKDYQWEKEGDCFCAAPKSCKCIDGKCEGVFEEDETADWETYRNEEYGFEVKYPPEWKIKERYPQAVWFDTSKSFKGKFYIGSNAYADFGGVTAACKFYPKDLIIGVIKISPLIVSYGDFKEFPTPEECNNLPKHAIFGEFCLDPIFGEQEQNCGQGSGNIDYQFELTCENESWKGEEGRKSCLTIFNQILSTFRFLD